MSLSYERRTKDAGKAARPSEQTAPEQAISVPGCYIFYHIGCF